MKSIKWPLPKDSTVIQIDRNAFIGLATRPNSSNTKLTRTPPNRMQTKQLHLRCKLFDLFYVCLSRSIYLFEYNFLGFVSFFCVIFFFLRWKHFPAKRSVSSHSSYSLTHLFLPSQHSNYTKSISETMKSVLFVWFIFNIMNFWVINMNFISSLRSMW